MDCTPGPGPCNILELEELESLRLKDLEKLDQAECAEKMQISRPTFQRILLSARRKVSDSLIYGKKLIIRTRPAGDEHGLRGRGNCCGHGVVVGRFGKGK
jgi:predicted DNA-binding protein (UPF0251 family)